MLPPIDEDSPLERFGAEERKATKQSVVIQAHNCCPGGTFEGAGHGRSSSVLRVTLALNALLDMFVRL